MIHEIKGHFVISSGRTWVPGCYESWRAANYAFRFPDEQLQLLQDTANKRKGIEQGIISYSDLKESK